MFLLACLRVVVEPSHKRRTSRGGSIRVSVKKKAPTYKEFIVYMRDNENKTEPFEMIASGSTSFNSLNYTIIATNQCFM